MKIQTLLITTLAIASLNAQTAPADPYVKNNKEAKAVETAEDSTSISICYEDFSLPLAQAAALRRERLTDAEFYAKVLAAVGKDDIRQETFSIARTVSGKTVTVESNTEETYPTEYGPAKAGITATDEDGKEIPAGPVPGPVAIAIARTPATPNAFETRNTGFTLELEPTLSKDRNSVDLRIVPEHVTLVGRSAWGKEISTTEMPIFESQRLNMAVTLTLNEPYLLGTPSLPPGSKQDPDSAKRVWFAFVTATLPK
jgi:hypothetical protein